MVEIIIPTNYDPNNPRPHSGTRPLIPVQMQLPNGTWSETVIFNFDTGASFPTDIPLQLLDDFGYKEVKNGSTRPTYNKKVRIVGFGIVAASVPANRSACPAISWYAASDVTMSGRFARSFW